MGNIRGAFVSNAGYIAILQGASVLDTGDKRKARIRPWKEMEEFANETAACVLATKTAIL